MLPFAFQVTDAHTQDNYRHHHPSNKRSYSEEKKVASKREKEPTYTYCEGNDTNHFCNNCVYVLFVATNWKIYRDCIQNKKMIREKCRYYFYIG